MSDSPLAQLTSSREAPATTLNGLAMLALLLLALVALAVAVVGRIPMFLVPSVVAVILLLPGFYMVQPNQAVAILLFGAYRGTDRAEGCAGPGPG
jgi:regulator of protease activity HflC (stomatin/prohibitin superfamily)